MRRGGDVVDHRANSRTNSRTPRRSIPRQDLRRRRHRLDESDDESRVPIRSGATRGNASPISRSRGTTCRSSSLNDTLYAIGGFDGARFTPKATLWIYRPDKNQWETRASLPAPRGASAAAVVERQDRRRRRLRLKCARCSTRRSSTIRARKAWSNACADSDEARSPRGAGGERSGVRDRRPADRARQLRCRRSIRSRDGSMDHEGSDAESTGRAGVGSIRRANPHVRRRARRTACSTITRCTIRRRNSWSVGIADADRAARTRRGHGRREDLRHRRRAKQGFAQTNVVEVWTP